MISPGDNKPEEHKNNQDFHLGTGGYRGYRKHFQVDDARTVSYSAR